MAEMLRVETSDRVPVLNGSRTICAFDNLLQCLRDLYYSLTVEGRSPTHVMTTPTVLAAYEALCGLSDHEAPVTRFKKCPCAVAAEIPCGEWWFFRMEEAGKPNFYCITNEVYVVGKVRAIS